MNNSGESTLEGNSVSKGFMDSIYQWILSKCNSRFAPYLLGILSFTESCMFIIPPEVLLLPMCYAKRERAFWYSFITTVTSVLGAMFGYYLGFFLWEEYHQLAFDYIPGFKKHFDHVVALYQKDAVFYLFLAAFTPIPFKVFTVAAGVSKISFITLVITSIIGRGVRYTILSGLVYFLGPKAKDLIEKHFTLFTIIVGVLAILLFVLLKVL